VVCWIFNGFSPHPVWCFEDLLDPITRVYLMVLQCVFDVFLSVFLFVMSMPVLHDDGVVVPGFFLLFDESCGAAPMSADVGMVIGPYFPSLCSHVFPEMSDAVFFPVGFSEKAVGVFSCDSWPPYGDPVL